MAYTKSSTNSDYSCSKLWGKLVPWAISVEWGHVDISVALCVPTLWPPVLCLVSPISLDSRTTSVTALSLLPLPKQVIPVSWMISSSVRLNVSTRNSSDSSILVVLCHFLGLSAPSCWVYPGHRVWLSIISWAFCKPHYPKWNTIQAPGMHPFKQTWCQPLTQHSLPIPMISQKIKKRGLQNDEMPVIWLYWATDMWTPTPSFLIVLSNPMASDPNRSFPFDLSFNKRV